MTRIHLYNHVEDAWESSLANWLDQRSRASLEGEETWLVAGSYFQASWIRRMALSRNKSLFGIQVFDRRRLRRYLAGLCGLPEQSLGREVVQLLIDSAAAEVAPGYTGTGNLLNALDLLGASGALKQLGLETVCTLLEVPEPLQATIGEIISSPYWTARLDSLLLDRVTLQKNLRVGFFGLDADNIRELPLLLSAANRATQSVFWIAQPLGKEELGFNWITVLENALQTEASVCPIGEASRRFEDFLGYWQGGTGSRRVVLPEIMIGKRWCDQVNGIVRRVTKALTEKAQSVLVVVSENSPTGNAVVQALIARGIAVADEVRERRALPRAAEVQIAVAQFLFRDRTPEEFLRIIQFLIRSQKFYRSFRGALIRSFEIRQSRSVALLITDELRENFPWLIDLEEALQPLPEKATCAELSRLWRSILDRISVVTSRHSAAFAPVHFSGEQQLLNDLGPVIEGRLLASQLFLQFVIRSLSARVREPHPESDHRYSKVCVATALKAHGTSWDCVILADSVADAWPRSPAPNPLLSDELKIQLRSQRFIIPTASEQRAAQEERYLQLAYSAKMHLVLARQEQDEKGIELVPNNLATFAAEFLKAKTSRVRSEPVHSPEEVTARFAKICAARSDPDTPFDAYFLSFKGINFPTREWHPSELETVFKTPGTFAFRLIFGCEREFDRRFTRSASMTVGRLTHRLLQRGFAGSGQFRPLDSSAKWTKEESCMQFLHAMEIAAARMRKDLMPHGVDLWWESILNKASMFATQMLEQVSARFEENQWYHSEATLTGTLSTATGDLKLEGRTDLILSNMQDLESANPIICDFKTSKRIQRFDSERGENLQFLGYRILAELNGAQGTEILVIKPDRLRWLNLPPDEALAELISRLARLQTDKNFGRRPSEKWEQTEKLPIATLPIDAAVLERKLELTWN